MLSIEQTKKLIDDITVSDREVARIRGLLYALAELIFDEWHEKKLKKENNNEQT